MALQKRPTAEVFPLKDFLKEEMEERGWSQADLAAIIGCQPRDIHDLVTGKVVLRPKMATALGDAFGTSPEYWMNLETAHRAWLADKDDRETISRRGRLYEMAPIREMQKRFWLPQTDNADTLEGSLKVFLSISSLDEVSRDTLSMAARMSASVDAMWASVNAWACRARNIAPAVRVSRQYSQSSMSDCLAGLKPLLSEPMEVRHVPRVMAENGIRLVIVEHLSKTKIDGGCLWLDKKSPVVALSMRFDRLDWFWFTLMHELAHVKHGNGLSGTATVDTNLVGSEAQKASEKSSVEAAADAFAEDYLVPRSEMDNFIARTRPLYARERIKAFSKRINVHPAIVVGQLQFRGEIPYYHSRDLMKDKVREIVTANAITDGLGHTLNM